MSFEFNLPLNRGDLLRRSGANHYVVEEVFPIRIIPSKLQELQGSLRSQGSSCILTHFDTLYSVLSHGQNIQPEMRSNAWTLLLRIVVQLNAPLVEVLESENSSNDPATLLNVLKMASYLLCQYMEAFESEVSRPLAVLPSGKGRKKRQTVVELGNMDWEDERERGVRALLQLLQLNLYRLWNPPVVEVEFVNLITCCCYKLLENPDVVKNKGTRDTIFQLLGTMVKKYDHALSCSLKLLQLLQHFEHLTSHLAQAVSMFANDFGAKSITAKIMREIGNMDMKDLARDTSGTRAYATFLVELAERIPAIMLPSISVLLGLLDGESYSMRNSVLGVMGEMLIKVLSKEELDAKQKSTRDQFLDKLEDHIHDVNAFTRSKTLQIWLSIVNEKALPLPRQHQLLELVIGRLQDKSSQARKCAMQLLTALLRSNPFAAKLPVEELKENYEKEKAKLAEMKPEEPELTAADVAKQELEKEWVRYARGLKKVFTSDEEVDSEEGEKGDEPKLIGDEDTVESVKAKIVTLVKDGHYKEAVHTFQSAREEWPTDPAFLVAVPLQMEEAQSQDEEDRDPEEKEQLETIKSIRNIFFGELLQPNVLEGALQQSSQESQNTSLVNEVTKQQVLVQYLKDTMNFVIQVQKAVPIVCQLLGSKNQTDVLEAINFFVTGFKFGVSNSMVGIRRMLVLIWSKEPVIKEAVVEAYRSLYLGLEENNSRVRSLAVVNNLTALTVGATIGDLTSLEELVSEFVRSKDLDSHVVQLLWERFAMKIPNTAVEESRGALVLLGMAAGAQVDIVRSNVDVLVKEGLGERGETDLLLVKDTCVALTKLAPQGKEKPGVAHEPFRFPQDHDIFKRLEHILVQSVDHLSSRHWVPMVEQAVNVIYLLAEHPDLITGSIVKRVAAKALEKASEGQKTVTPESTEATEENQPSTSQGSTSSSPEGSSSLRCPSALMTRLLSLVGHVALRQLIHLEVATFGELKRRHQLQEQQHQGKRQAKPKGSNKQRESSPEEDEDMGITGAAAEDAEAEYIRKITETEIVTGENLLAALRPLLVAVCNNQAKYADPELQAAASLALAKYMLVSSEFCEDHLQLLFTILERSPHAVIRANTIIAMGDLTFRFPNLIEPWTPNLYARLRDPSPQVRKNTLMVLTHLILNDMVKVKGQISELATCIVDDNSRISGLAKLFFHELAKKGNAIYNIMPDMVSRLSDTEVGVEEDHFRTIMKYLFTFIQKDRQCESLVEKLCHRFRATRIVRQWRDLAFCLSMLSYSDKSIRKLQENIGCFNDKLADEDVYGSFVTIMNNAKKFAKPETKALVEELEQRLEQYHSKGVEDAEAEDRASKATKRTPSRKGKGKGRTPATTRARRHRKSGGGSDDDFLDQDSHPVTRHTGGQPSNKGSQDKPKFSVDSDEDSDIELFQVQKEAKNRENEDKLLNDMENKDPNISFESPGFHPIKKRHRSVSNAKAVRSSSRTTRSRIKKA